MSAERVEATLKFAELGCRIVPARGKRPGGFLGDGWPAKATRNPDLIRFWWHTWAQANVAILADRAALPVDVDNPEAFAEFGREHGPAPPTPRYLTGGAPGRERLLFQFPGDELLARIGRKLTDGVQLRHSHDTNLICVVPPGVSTGSCATTRPAAARRTRTC